MYSLQKKLTRTLVINMLIVMLSLLVILYFSARHILFDYIATRLQHDAESLIALIDLTAEENWRIDPLRMSTVYNRVRSGHYYRVESLDQVAVSRSLFDMEFPLTTNMTSETFSTIPAPDNGSWLIWHQKISKSNHRLKVWVAEDITPVEGQLRRYSAYALLLVAGITFILIYLQNKTLRRSFEIFEQLRQNLEKIRQQEIERSGINPPEEIMPLVNEIEHLVTQLGKRIQRTRHAIGNLAHELKRPIQMLTLLLDQTDPQVAEPLQTIQNIINRELKRVRIAGPQGRSENFDPADGISSMLRIMQALYPDIDIQTSVTGCPTQVKLDRDDLLELAGNLMDNACKFALSTARLAVSCDTACLTLVFEDDGNGLQSRDLESIQQRGVRLDETREGQGIGLSLCKDIIESYRGNLDFSKSPLGGLRVAAEIPLTRA